MFYTFLVTCDQAVLIDQPCNLFNSFFRTLVETLGAPSHILVWSKPEILVCTNPRIDVLKIANARKLAILHGAVEV